MARRNPNEPWVALRGTAQPMAKLTEAQVLEIRARIANGETPNEICKHYGVTPTCILHIAKRINWAWLK